MTISAITIENFKSNVVSGLKTSRWESKADNTIHGQYEKNCHALLHLPEFEFTADCLYPI